MKRDLRRLSDECFDLLVIGGGITGACVARDAAMRGLSVALLEKNDFAHATSAHNSKLIHGGLRYLRNFELGLVRESLRERRIWQRIAPHLVHPLPFLIPLYGAGWSARAQLAAGLTLYDALSFDRGWVDDPAQRLPGHCWLNSKAALAREPAVEGPQLEGAFQYYDAQMYSPERLALECLRDAEAHGAVPANHITAEKLLLRGERVEGASVADAFSDARFDIRASLTLIAAGPWADIFLAAALGKPASHRVLRSKGIHLIVRSITRGAALTMAANGGHFFVLPWRGTSLLGTTDTAFTGHPDSVGVTEQDIADFLGFIDTHLPSAHLTRANVQHFYAGLRPLVDDHSGDTYDASRRAELIDHAKDDGVDGLFSAIGGKWTTSRHLAEQIVDAVVAKLGKSADVCRTATTKLTAAPEIHFNKFLQRFAQQLPPPLARGGELRAQRSNSGEGAFGARAMPLPQSSHAAHVRIAPSPKGRGTSEAEHIAHMYGRRAAQVLTLAQEEPALQERLSTSGDIAAQVLYAVREEMALTLDDVVMQRTGIGQLGNPGAAVLDRVANMMASELRWSEERHADEIAAVEKNFTTQASA